MLGHHFTAPSPERAVLNALALADQQTFNSIVAAATVILPAERDLRAHVWTESRDEQDQLILTSPDGEFRATLLHDGYVAAEQLGYVSNDIETMRFFPLADGFDWAQVRAELVNAGALPFACPNCGDEGGTPRSAYSREWQGCAEHGGMVESVETGCSRCIREGR